ncbi:LamG domain-containing protein [Aquimarina macrocephali]|uniref:LamG domain-containing protein n=1 Tax=Aquimarina macrocephali TaxID=666563 RepID=UPI00137682D0|nr:LamG domain-containing protein [Aquimarina macrocephali]
MKNFLLGTVLVLMSTLGIAQTANDALIGYWPFNNNANDIKGANNGVVFGNVTSTIGKDGQENTAYYFDGVDDYIQILTPQLSQMTIAFWIKPDGIVNDTRLISSLNASSTNVMGIGYYDQTIKVWGPTWKTVIGGYDQTVQAKWSLVCFTIDANKNMTGYLNGVPGMTESFSELSTHLGIGKKYSLNGNSYGSDFKGSMDEFMIFNRVLTDSEIQSLAGGNSNTISNGWISDNSKVYVTTESVGIGTANPDSKLTVKGKIHAEEVKIDLSVPAPDYVFTKEYDLLTIEEVQQHIKEKGHLPNIPSATEMEQNGVELGVINMKLLEKIEELTLYTIAQEKQLKEQQKVNKALEDRLKKIEGLLLK